MQYIFILGNNPNLSVAEIKAVWPEIKIIDKSNKYLVAEIDDFNPQMAMKQLGGVIKIGKVISNNPNKEKIIQILKNKSGGSKLNFGFSYYGVKSDFKFGITIKKELKRQGISCRLVTAKSNDLSSVIVKKEKVVDFLILPNMIGITEAIQDFVLYGKLDYGRPQSDAVSGMLPPKLAKIMINLSGVCKNNILLDPFCGSGTVLMEASMLGIKNIIGTDKSDKAIADTKENMDWLIDEMQIKIDKLQIFQADIITLSTKIDKADTVVTEPYLGPAIRGDVKISEIVKTKSELEKLYISAFKQMAKILPTGGKMVIVFPLWQAGNENISLCIDEQIKKIGFNRIDKGDLIYKRTGQKIWREIYIGVKNHQL